jgi:hypothetical protein
VSNQWQETTMWPPAVKDVILLQLHWKYSVKTTCFLCFQDYLTILYLVSIYTNADPVHLEENSTCVKGCKIKQAGHHFGKAQGSRTGFAFAFCPPAQRCKTLFGTGRQFHRCNTLASMLMYYCNILLHGANRTWGWGLSISVHTCICIAFYLF